MIDGTLPASFALLQSAMAAQIAALSVDDPAPAAPDAAPEPTTSSGVLAGGPDGADAPPPPSPTEPPPPSADLSLAGLRAPDAARDRASTPSTDAPSRPAMDDGAARTVAAPRDAAPAIEPESSTPASRAMTDAAGPTSAPMRPQATQTSERSPVARLASPPPAAGAGAGDRNAGAPRPDPASAPSPPTDGWTAGERPVAAPVDAGRASGQAVPDERGASAVSAAQRPEASTLATAAVALRPADDLAAQRGGRAAERDETGSGGPLPDDGAASDGPVGPARPDVGASDAPVRARSALGSTRDAGGSTASPMAMPSSRAPVQGDAGRAPAAGPTGRDEPPVRPQATHDDDSPSTAGPPPGTVQSEAAPSVPAPAEAGTLTLRGVTAEPHPAGAGAGMRDPARDPSAPGATAPDRGFIPHRSGPASGASASPRDPRPAADSEGLGLGRAGPERDVTPSPHRPAAAGRARASDDRRPGIDDRTPAREGDRRDGAVADPTVRRPQEAAPAPLPAAAGTALSEALEALAGPTWSGSAEGIIPSLVFNAAMIPGWPPPRPFEASLPEAAPACAAPTRAGEAELAHRLTERGGEAFAHILARMPQKLSRRRRRRLLLAMAAMMDVIDAVLSAVEQELLEVARRAAESESEIDEAGLRRSLTA